MMQRLEPGAQVVLTEHVVTVGAFGSEMVPRGTIGTLVELRDDFAKVRTRWDTYKVPADSIAPREAA